MSFSSDIKKELCSVKLKKDHCILAELSGIIYLSGTLALGSGGLSIVVNTENPDVVRRTLSLAKSTFSIDGELSLKKGPLKKNDIYVMRFSGREQVLFLLERLGLSIDGGVQVSEHRFLEITAQPCCQAAFIRGAFLGGGVASDPQKQYQIEFVTGSPATASVLCDVISRAGFSSKITQRKDSHVVYSKDGENIINLLTFIGAHSSVLALEDVRIMKDILNNVNRRLNFDTANIDRTVTSASAQTANILLSAEQIGFDHQPKALRDTAELRLAYPEASLAELADLSGGTSKSGINHRLRKLNEIAKGLRETLKEE